MSLIDRILKRLGYVKADIYDSGIDGAVQPQANPSSIPSSPEKEDYNRQDLDDTVTDIREPSPHGFPENLTVNPAPEVKLVHRPEAETELATPDNAMALPEANNTGGQHTQKGPDISEHQINPLMDFEEVNGLSPAIGMKLKKLGIKSVDRQLFMQAYRDLQRTAMIKKVSISEIINNEIF